MRRFARAARRLILETAGWLMLAGGLAAIPLPGPGLLIVFGGLLLLARQYDWAERRVDSVRLRVLEGARHSVATWPRLAASIVGAVVVLAGGVLWVVSPAAPASWPLGETWWLPGGMVVGVTQLGSAVLALALLAYSCRRFRGGPRAATGLASDLEVTGEPAPTAGSLPHVDPVPHEMKEIQDCEMACGCASRSAA